MSKILVTGANRGIGLEICRQLLAQQQAVIAVCRQASAELKALDLQCLEGFDLAQDDSLTQLKTALAGENLLAMINNAGLMERTPLEALDFDACRRQLEVNTFGPLRVVLACLEQLQPGGKILMVTSRMGSIGDNSSGSAYGYRMSKAALNMATVSLAHDLKDRQIAVGLVHPGYVRTQMTGFSGHLDPHESAAGILARLQELNLQTSGTFWHVHGDVLPW